MQEKAGIGVAIAGGQKPTLSKCTVGLTSSASVIKSKLLTISF
jgi:hypothetical protein